MPTDTTAATAAATSSNSAATTSVPQITLDQFATEVSARDKRIALLHGFVFQEKLARRFKDTESNYQARFVTFASQSV